MARRDPGPRRSQSVDAYRHQTRPLAVLALLALAGGIVSDALDGSFWVDHPLLAGLAASVIVVLLTVALVNEAVERRSRQRWRVLAQYVMLQLVRDARLVWSTVADMAGLMPSHPHPSDSDFLAASASIEAGSEAVRDTPRLTAALRDLLADADRRRRLYQAIVSFTGQHDEVLGRWASVMLNADVYAEVIDRHVELAGDLAWLRGLLGFELSEDEDRVRLGRGHPAALVVGPLDNEELAQRVAAITQLAEQLDSMTLALALRVVPIEWWRAQLGANAPTPLGEIDLSVPQPSQP